MREYPFEFIERHRYDAFCKTVLRNEARSYLKSLGRRRERETEFSALPQSEMDKLCIIDCGKEVSNLERRMAELTAGDTAGRRTDHARSTAAPER